MKTLVEISQLEKIRKNKLRKSMSISNREYKRLIIDNKTLR